tara:strand:+ start:4880 stop:5731 length:852 start_codon:yes stop_codon:yes gene_type:complete
MKITDLRSSFHSQLKEFYPAEEIDSFFYQLVEKYLNMRRIDVALDREKMLAVEQAELFKSALLRLKKKEPLQYILGETEFYGYNFLVTPDVLIPRPETEELVSWIVDDCGKSNEPLKILDIGTGSGCIAISLAKQLTHAKVSALDISKDALAIAKKNALQNNAEINFIEADVLNVDDFQENYDIIVSNPPYVRELEKEQMHDNVLNNEPHGALFVTNEDPLIFYRQIAQLASRNLKPEGTVYFEINEYLGEETCILLKNSGFVDVLLRQDMFKKDRMLKGIKS